MKNEIKSLTGLRGVAALAVMGYHYHFYHARPGYLMVDLFFVLSGVVMARTYGESFRRGFNWTTYTRFLQKRLARIYPLYVVVVLTVVAVVLASGFPFPTGADHPKHPLVAAAIDLPLLQNLGGGMLCHSCSSSLVSPAWSISTEVGAYLLFPMLVSLALFRSLRLTSTGLVLAAAAVVLVSLVPSSWSHQPFRSEPLNIFDAGSLWPLLRCLAEFYVGLVVWRASTNLPPWSQSPWVGATLLGALVMLWFTPGSDLLIVTTFPLLILHLCTDKPPLARFLSLSWSYAVGEWSYAIYLIHYPLLGLKPALLSRLEALGLPLAQSITVIALAILCVALAALSHRWIEKPARQWVRSAFNRPPLPMALEPSAP